MLTFTTAEARRDLADVIRMVRSTRQRAVITRYGLPLVAIVPIQDLERLTQVAPSGGRRGTAHPGGKTAKKKPPAKR
jgi:prevent-host-death family protein